MLSTALQHRLRALTPREIALLATGAAVTALWLGTDAYDRYRTAADRASTAATSAASAQDQLLSYGSADLQRRIADELDRARRQTITGPTAELAELQLQDELSVAATRAGLRNPQVSAVRGEDDRKPIHAIAATVEGDYDRGALVGLLANLAQSETDIRVTEIDVSNDGAAPRLAVTGEAVFVAPGLLR